MNPGRKPDGDPWPHLGPCTGHVEAIQPLEALEIRLALRDLCRQYGDNDWPDDLAIPDVIEKHLVRPMADKLAAQERLIRRLEIHGQQLQKALSTKLYR